MTDILFTHVPGGIVTIAILRWLAAFAALTLATRYRKDRQVPRAAVSVVLAAWLMLGGLSSPENPSPPTVFQAVLYGILAVHCSLVAITRAQEAHDDGRT